MSDPILVQQELKNNMLKENGEERNQEEQSKGIKTQFTIIEKESSLTNNDNFNKIEKEQRKNSIKVEEASSEAITRDKNIEQAIIN